MEDINHAYEEERPMVKRRKISRMDAWSLPNEDFYCHLITAILETNYKATVKLLKDVRFGLNVLFDDYNTPLTFAVIMGRIDFLKLLVCHGAHVNWDPSPMYLSPLTIACREGNVEVVKFLLKLGADINKASMANNTVGITPLCMAVRNATPELVSLLLDHGAAIDPSYDIRCSPIGCTNLLTLDSARSSMVAILLRHGVPVSSNPARYASTLHIAVQHCDKDSVVLLMECGAKPSHVDWSKVDLDSDPNFYAWCKPYISQPLSLKCLSGQVIRQCLVETHKKSILPYLTELKLPKILVNYLALDRFSFPEEGANVSWRHLFQTFEIGKKPMRHPR